MLIRPSGYNSFDWRPSRARVFRSIVLHGPASRARPGLAELSVQRPAIPSPTRTISPCNRKPCNRKPGPQFGAGLLSPASKSPLRYERPFVYAACRADQYPSCAVRFSRTCGARKTTPSFDFRSARGNCREHVAIERLDANRFRIVVYIAGNHTNEPRIRARPYARRRRVGRRHGRNRGWHHRPSE